MNNKTKFLIARIIVFIGMVIGIIVLVKSINLPETCKHEHIGKIFIFPELDSTSQGYVKTYCVGCDTYYGDGEYMGYYGGTKQFFRGTPSDTSFLEALSEYSDEKNIIAGEYYTITAIVTRTAYDYAKTRIRCKVEIEDVSAEFFVDFREEVINLMQEGEEITFRGRFYDTGCGFTDCELIEME